MLDDKKGPTRTQLKARIARLEQEVARYKRQLEPDPLRRPGEHWYELTHHFDGTKAQRIPVHGAHAFLMGQLRDLVVVEMPDDASSTKFEEVSKWLSDRGIKGIMVSRSVQFLKLRAVDEAGEAELDAAQLGEHERVETAEAETEETETADDKVPVE